MSSVTLAIGFGLFSASILALGAVGLTLQFAVADLFNLAFGEVMTVAAFAGYGVWVSGHTDLWLGLAAGAAAGAVASVLLNLAIFEPFRRRGSSGFTMVMVTLGASVILVNLAQIAAGVYSYSYPPQSVSSVQFLGMSFTSRQLGLIAFSVVAIGVLELSLRRTRMGKAIRATASNSDLASICGVSTRRVGNATWLISGVFCGTAGVAFASNAASFDYNLGSGFFFLIAAAAVFGGIGKPTAAVVGAVILGVVSELAAIVDPVLREVVAFCALVIVLLLRPAGLLTSRRAMMEERVS